tara:strand:- start:238 stop:1215 length:978 start_codon:yes stop_codon:yes gene_type:complete
MNEFIHLERILPIIDATKIKSIQVIQNLWSDYGHILRINTDSKKHPSIIVKDIHFSNIPNHPRGWNSDISHQRKIKSYEVEESFYKYYALKCKASIVPRYINCIKDKNRTLLIIEDLDAIGFNERKRNLKPDEVKSCIHWIANFHATFLKESPSHLWPIGTYWHLKTRQDEFKQITDKNIIKYASLIDHKLRNTNYKTIVHGDAKVANFCFNPDEKKVAAVDFQYVGGGCGIKDLAYFIGSTLDESQCELYENEILDYYFDSFFSELNRSKNFINNYELEHEWRYLYSFAWADFHRFLLGWKPDHYKLTNYSQKMLEKTILKLNS